MGAPIGNKFAVGNNGGRPPIYDNPEKLQQECDEYFQYLVDNNEPATITGLALYLGFCGRQGLYDIAKNKEFSFIIKRAMAKVESSYEQNLRENNAAGSIFALKNMGWRDKVETGFTDNEGNDLKALPITFK